MFINASLPYINKLFDEVDMGLGHEKNMVYRFFLKTVADA